MKHDYMACQSNICRTDPGNNGTTWFPFEGVCTAGPLIHWQRIQRRIHKLYLKGKLKNIETYYFLKDLDVIQRVTPSTEGRNPERKIK